MSGSRDIQHDHDALALKVVTRKATQAAGGTKVLAQFGTRQQRLSDCGCPNTADFLRVDEVAAIEDLSVGRPGWPHFTRHLAARQGFALVQLPSPDLPDTQWSQRCATLLREVGETVAGIGEALADDLDVSPEEAKVQLVEVDEMVAAAVELQAALRRRADGLY